MILDYSRLGDEKLAIFSQLDLRIDKKLNFKKFAFDVFIEAQNVLSQDIPSPTDYGLNRNSMGMIVEPRSLVAIENGAGQIIPSIGIVVDF